MTTCSPIYVDFVAQEAHGQPGRLGLTMAPGKCDGFTARDLAADLQRLRDEYHADLLVSLLEPQEYEWLGIANLREKAAQADIDVTFLPIPDADVPDAMADCRTTVGKAVAALRDGKTVVVHCRGGLGRSGLVSACCLVDCGMEPDAAMVAVRKARRGAIENRAQEAFVERYAEEAEMRSASDHNRSK